MEKNFKLNELPSLDGWRAVSIGMVLLLHSSFTAGFPKVFDRIIGGFDAGILGVRFFFVISGFLITYLLLREQSKHGEISLKNFYTRRGLRILPVYFVYLLFLVVFTKYHQSTRDWAANLTFTTNFFPTPFTTTHLWSLGVEEQFYLLWPLALVWLLRRPPQSIVSSTIGVLCIPILVAPMVRLANELEIYPQSIDFLFYHSSFFSRFDSLAFGCLAAVLYAKHTEFLSSQFIGKPFFLSGVGVGMILTAPIFRFLHVPLSLQAAGSDSLQAFGFSMLLIQSIYMPKFGFYRALNWRWVSHIGKLSYSIYIWQELFCAPGESIWGRDNYWFVRFPGCIVAALLAAHASYYLLEKPLLGLRARFR